MMPPGVAQGVVALIRACCGSRHGGDGAGAALLVVLMLVLLPSLWLTWLGAARSRPGAPLAPTLFSSRSGRFSDPRAPPQMQSKYLEYRSIYQVVFSL
jgi:hypothetical protein